MRKALVFSIGLLTTLVGAFPVYADTTLYSQTISTAVASSSAGQNFIDIRLGSGLTGIAHEVSVKFGISNYTTASAVSMDLCSYTDAAYSANQVCAGDVDIIASLTGPRAVAQYFVNTAVPFTLNPSRYYVINLYMDNFSLEKWILTGSAAEVYSGGDCLYNGGGGITGIKDCFFVLNGVQTSSDSSYTTNIQPTNASTTATTQVYTSFTYHAAAANNITSYSMLFTDLTSPQSFTIEGAASTGDATISQVISLASGHTYNLVVYICNNSGSCYGGPVNTFSVVASNFSIGTTLPGILSGTSTINNLPLPIITNINDNNASSSLQTAINTFSNVPGYFAERVPWGYLFEIRDIYTAASTSTSEFGAITIDFANASGLSSSTKSWLPSSLTVISTTSIAYYFNGTALSGANTLLAAIGWIGMMGYWFRRATQT